MSRTLSSGARGKIHGRTPGDGEILLLRITHADVGTLRYAAANEDVVSGGDTYASRAFRVPLPADEDGIMETTLALDVTTLADATVASLVAAAGDRPQVEVDIVLESDPDTVEATFFFEMRNAEAPLAELRASLTYEPLLARAYPGDIYDGARFPDLVP